MKGTIFFSKYNILKRVVYRTHWDFVKMGLVPQVCNFSHLESIYNFNFIKAYKIAVLINLEASINMYTVAVISLYIKYPLHPCTVLNTVLTQKQPDLSWKSCWQKYR